MYESVDELTNEQYKNVRSVKIFTSLGMVEMAGEYVRIPGIQEVFRAKPEIAELKKGEVFQFRIGGLLHKSGIVLKIIIHI